MKNEKKLTDDKLPQPVEKYAKAYSKGKTDWLKGKSLCTYKLRMHRHAWLEGWLNDDPEKYMFNEDGYAILPDQKLVEFNNNAHQSVKNGNPHYNYYERQQIDCRIKDMNAKGATLTLGEGLRNLSGYISSRATP